MARSGGAKAWDKSPGHPVTEADLAVDRLLRERLLSARPGDAWLSEETADNADRLAHRRVWVVDPIDGTRDFARGRPGWCVSVALVTDGAPVVAALASPSRNELWAAAHGQGTTLNNAPVRVSGRTDPQGLRIPTDPQTLLSRFWPPGFRAVTVPKPNSIALRAALVADGRADALMEARTTNEWDLAACALIALEAGATVTDRDGRPHRFNQPKPVLHGIVATTPALHAHALERLSEMLANWRRTQV